MNKRTLTLLSVISVIIISCVIGCTRSPKTVNTVRIGTILPLTGPAASLGQQLRQGQQAAIAYINENMLSQANWKLELMVEDGKANPTDSVAAFRKLRNLGVQFFETTTTPVSLALAPLAQQEKVLLFADASHPDLSNAGDLVFRYSNTAPQEAEILTTFATVNLNANRIVLAAVQDDFGSAFIDESRKLLGNNLISAEYFSKTDQDLRGVAQNILGFNPDAVIIIGVGSATGLLANRLREAGFSGNILGNIAMNLPDAIAAAGEAYQQIYHTTFDYDKDSEQYKEFANIFSQKYNLALSEFALNAIVSMYLIFYGINNNHNASPDMVADILRNQDTFSVAGMQIRRKGNDFLPQLKVVQGSI